MEGVTPGPEAARLRAFAGEWEGEEILHPAPWRPSGGRARGRFRSRMALSGHFLVVDYEERQGEEAVYSGHGVYGFDGKAGRYAMYWFDSAGSGTPQAVPGVWTGDGIRYEAVNPSARARYTYRLLGADEFSFSIETAPPEGDYRPFLEGRYRRL
jgi:hypothetical protein